MLAALLCSAPARGLSHCMAVAPGGCDGGDGRVRPSVRVRLLVLDGGGAPGALEARPVYVLRCGGVQLCRSSCFCLFVNGAIYYKGEERKILEYSVCGRVALRAVRPLYG